MCSKFGEFIWSCFKKKSLLYYTKNQSFSITTKKFEISNFKKETSKINIFIPSNTAFGTGSHPSTFLVIRNLEKIFMKGKFKKLSFLDVGTGTGILSFVIYKLSNKKIHATDVDLESQSCFYRNIKLNSISNFRFYRCDGLNNHYLKKKKFTLIVSNILLLPLKKLEKVLDIFQDITKSELYNQFNFFDLRVFRRVYMSNKKC